MCSFGLAINRNWKDRDGNKQQETTFVECEAWAKTADLICQYFTKGKPIFISGRLKFDQWQDQTGANRSKIKVVVTGFQFVGGRDSGTDNTAPQSHNAISVGEDDIPF